MGLSFADTTDANVFYTKVMGREPVAPTKKKPSKKKKGITMDCFVYDGFDIDNST